MKISSLKIKKSLEGVKTCIQQSFVFTDNKEKLSKTQWLVWCVTQNPAKQPTKTNPDCLVKEVTCINIL